MQPSTDAIASHDSSVEIAASCEAVYSLVADITRMGEWSPEAVGGDWLDGGGPSVGSRFEGHNQAGEREWSRECEVVVADEGRDFTFVVGGLEANYTWWSYEMEPTAGGTRLTERWWVVNKSPAIAALSEDQFQTRAAFTKTMLDATLAALKTAAER